MDIEMLSNFFFQEVTQAIGDKKVFITQEICEGQNSMNLFYKDKDA